MAGRYALLTSHTGHLWVLEAADYFANGFSIDHRVGVRHDGNVGVNHADAVVQRCRLSLTLGSKDDFHLRIAGQAGIGVVGRTVGHPDNAELVRGVVQSVDVLHLLLYDVLFVIGADHEGDSR